VLRGITITASHVKAIPDGMSSITPHLMRADAANAIAIYKSAFSATELMCLPSPDGKRMHACVQIGGLQVFLTDDSPAYGALDPRALKGSPVTIHLHVENADAVFAQAINAGATVKMPMADMFWGDRYGQIQDPFAHHWPIATHQHDLTPEQMQTGMMDMFSASVAHNDGDNKETS
jgi:PhnB protein